MAAGFIFVFANSKYPQQTVVAVQPLLASDIDGLESVERADGWICVFSVMVADLPRNLKMLARSLDLPELEPLLDVRPGKVTRALHRGVQGELHLKTNGPA